jgi:hypothetical protein
MQELWIQLESDGIERKSSTHSRQFWSRTLVHRIASLNSRFFGHSMSQKDVIGGDLKHKR